MFLSLLMLETLSVKPSTGPATGARADPTWGTVRTQQCRRVDKSTRFVLADGREITSTTVLMTDAAILMTDLIFMPGASTADNSNGRRALGIDTANTLDGAESAWLVYMP